jgi:hypothetical protein
VPGLTRASESEARPYGRIELEGARMNSATPTKGLKLTRMAVILLGLAVLMIPGCAGPSGGPIPLPGPPFDQLASFILLGGLLLGAVAWIRKSNRGPLGRLGDRWRGSSAAEDILRERYARGEINRSQFAQMLDDLRKGPSLS